MGPFRSGEVSEGPSSSSAMHEDTEEDTFSQKNIPNLERFYAEMLAKAQLPTHPPCNTNSNWMLSLARSYRRLSKERRSRGRLRALLQPGGQGVPAVPGALPLQRPTTVAEGPSWSSNTDDSGYEGGYETDADESEFSEREGSVRATRTGHKRKLDALVQLTMRLSVAEKRGVMTSGDSECSLGSASASSTCPALPPLKTPRAFGTQAVGLRLSLPNSPLTESDRVAAVAATSAVTPAALPSASASGSSSWSDLLGHGSALFGPPPVVRPKCTMPLPPPPICPKAPPSNAMDVSVGPPASPIAPSGPYQASAMAPQASPCAPSAWTAWGDALPKPILQAPSCSSAAVVVPSPATSPMALSSPPAAPKAVPILPAAPPRAEEEHATVPAASTSVGGAEGEKGALWTPLDGRGLSGPLGRQRDREQGDDEGVAAMELG